MEKELTEEWTHHHTTPCHPCAQLMPSETEVWTNDQILNSATPTYAHALGAGGYSPVQIGRMHLNGLDQYHGFSERYVGDHNRNFLGSPREPGTP